MAKKSQSSRKTGVKSRSKKGPPKKRIGDNIDIRSDTWMRNKVQEFNDKGMPVFVETLVPIADGERPEKWEKRYPPGKDKQQGIVNSWVADGYAIRDLKNGIVLLDMTEVRKLPGLAHAEIYQVEPAIKDLETKNRQKKIFHKNDFFKYVMLKKKLLSIPTKFLIYSKQSLKRKLTIHSGLISYVEKRLKLLEEIKDEQMTFENNMLPQYFDQIESLVERIIDSPESFAQKISGKDDFAELKADHDEINMMFEYIKG